ncbi:mRNA-decapping enzyme 1A isoform X1 [Stegostoma tigrinum]|uniref:mRNA-decapping enzyme 1A isoform X1 n=2 Tax=Stegostoma tigrinum TaxID=3053191 RepID=UPI00286FD588|nr:mRNA-decapping enzyme 1A isoform X1 [Stegostoma tigrinum]
MVCLSGKKVRGREHFLSFSFTQLRKSNMEALSKGRDISLSALKQNDPFISSIVDVTSQVALYTFNPKASEWEKTDIEGTLFVYTRSASPYHGFTIMNRLNMKNLVEPINKDLEFQLQDPFLLYRNSNLSIYSIWFYDKNDCQRIAQLMSKVVQMEAQRAQQESPGRTTPNKPSGYDEENPIDILDMLSKAKEEYEQTCQFGDSSILSSSPGIHNSAGLAVKKSIDEHNSSPAQHHNKHILSGTKHLTVEELFGAPVSKEHLMNSNQETLLTSQPDTKLRSQNLGLPFAYEHATELKQLGSPESQNNKINFSQISNSNYQEDAAQVLMTPAALQKSDIKTNRMYNISASPLFQSSLNFEATSNQSAATINTNGHSQNLQQEVKAVSPLMMCPSSEMTCANQNLPSGSNQTPQSGAGERSISDIGSQGHELLQKLKLTQQHDQQHQTLTKPSLAANFSPILVTPESFKEPNIRTTETSLQVVLTPTNTSSVGPSMLLSPGMFKHSTAMISETERKYGSTSPLTLASESRSSPLPTVLSKTQLQEALTHLIKNDSDFLNTIHEAYLQILRKNVGNIKL